MKSILETLAKASTGLAVLCLALAVLAVPSSHVKADEDKCGCGPRPDLREAPEHYAKWLECVRGNPETCGEIGGTAATCDNGCNARTAGSCAPAGVNGCNKADECDLGCSDDPADSKKCKCQ
jgi:hypothetical protein